MFCTVREVIPTILYMRSMWTFEAGHNRCLLIGLERVISDGNGISVENVNKDQMGGMRAAFCLITKLCQHHADEDIRC